MLLLYKEKMETRLTRSKNIKMDPEPKVTFVCVQEGSKLRVRVTSPGYNHDANCQFPRAIRVDGKTFEAPASALKFARGPAGKFFYRVTAKSISEVQVRPPPKGKKIKIAKIFEEENEECVICFDNPHDVVLVPCGHYCLCKGCADKLSSPSAKRRCPMCRGQIDQVVTKDMIQT